MAKGKHGKCPNCGTSVIVKGVWITEVKLVSEASFIEKLEAGQFYGGMNRCRVCQKGLVVKKKAR
jgi:hypothetical protein